MCAKNKVSKPQAPQNVGMMTRTTRRIGRGADRVVNAGARVLVVAYLWAPSPFT